MQKYCRTWLRRKPKPTDSLQYPMVMFTNFSQISDMSVQTNPDKKSKERNRWLQVSVQSVKKLL